MRDEPKGCFAPAMLILAITLFGMAAKVAWGLA